MQLESVVPLLFGSTAPHICDSSKSLDALHSRGMAQRKRQTVDDGINMMLPTFRPFMTNPFDHKVKCAAAAIVPRTFEKLAMSEQISDDKAVPGSFGRKDQ
ncbi:hypothetical protein DI43_05890 [Geobacillus sp. CAMR12739]|nr:hypothetical protein DI43_05890 [Geobacillus sp. CAMR12739]KZM54057.1 hypothetical protein A3Q36_09015 [Geobacillus stearothermophilus]